VTLITRRDAPNAVLMSQEHYDSLMETVHLLRSARLRSVDFSLLRFCFLFLLPVVMRLDGEEKARAQHEQLNRNQEYRNPPHDFLKRRISSLKIIRK
jgi:hypothetical protein